MIFVKETTNDHFSCDNQEPIVGNSYALWSMFCSAESH